MISVLSSDKYRNFTLITVSNFFFFCNFSSFFLLPLFIKNLGGDEAKIGYVMGTFGITSLGTIPVVSYFIDTYGRRSFILIGAIIMFASSFCFILIDELGYLIYLLRLIQGIGFAFFFTSASTAISDNVPAGIRAQGLGIFGAFTIASYAIGPSIGEFIIRYFNNYSYFFIYASSFSLFALILAYFSEEGSFSISKDRFALDFFKLSFSNRYSFLLLTNLIVAGGLGSMLNFYSVFLKSKGLSPTIFFLTYTITVIAVRLFGSGFSDRFERKKVGSPSLLILSLSLILVFKVNSFATALLISFLFSFGYGMLYPTLSAMVIDRASSNERGKAMGAFNASFSMGINYLAFPLGYIAKELGFSGMYLITGMFVFMGFLLFTFLENRISGVTKEI